VEEAVNEETSAQAIVRVIRAIMRSPLCCRR
jgi:hypothetical protein